MDKSMIGACGAYCGVCSWREPTGCTGCQERKGYMFWGSCTVARCAFGQGFAHCGLCEKLPCSPLREAFDNPEHGDNGERLMNLKHWGGGGDSIFELTKRNISK